MTTTSPGSGLTATAAADQFPLGTVEPDYVLTEALGTDPASLFTGIGAEDRAYWDRARSFVQDEVLPVIDGYWERAEYPRQLLRRLGELDLLRDGVAVEGFAPMSSMAAGLVNMEISRGDGSVATMIAVQGGLALRSVAECGSEEQKKRWLPAIAAGTEYAAFALTEPTHGSDAVGLESTATATDGGFLINGEKKWIGNGSIGGLTVVWARGEDGQVHGYLVPQDSPGYTGTKIEGKLALRAIWQAHIRLENVFVPEENVLPGARTFKDTARVLLATRLSVAWSAVGHATACYETAVQYAKQRKQFGRPLAASQIVQERLARMLSELSTMQLDGGPDDPARRGRHAHRRTGLAGQIHLYPPGPWHRRQRPGPAWRQRHPAGQPRRPAFGRHRSHPHLRGHRDHAGAHHRPRNHRHLSIRLTNVVPPKGLPMNQNATIPVILGGARTPFGRFRGGLTPFSASELGAHAIRAALERTGVSPEQIGAVIVGQVIQAGSGQGPARQASLAAGIGWDVPTVTINKLCLSGLTAVIDAARMIRAGEADFIVAAGQESMTNAPHLVPGLRAGVVIGDAPMLDSLNHDGLQDPVSGKLMGEATDAGNAERGISRAEQDAVAARSHQRAEAARAAGRACGRNCAHRGAPTQGARPVTGHDEGIRPETTAESWPSSARVLEGRGGHHHRRFLLPPFRRRRRAGDCQQGGGHRRRLGLDRRDRCPRPDRRTGRLPALPARPGH